MTMPSRVATPMYFMKPIYQQSEIIDLPNCMYKMKNIHAVDLENDASIEMTQEMKTLEQRQNKILSELDKLKNEINGLSENLGHITGGTEKTARSATTSTQNLEPAKLPDGILDFVISCSPSQPSFSPIFIAEILRSHDVTVSTPVQVHSSLQPNFDETVLKLIRGLHGRLQCPKSKVYFTYVWKEDCFCPSMSISSSTRIYGDVNIARYLSRLLLKHLYDEKNIEWVGEIDQWLENTRQLAHGNTKEKDAAMKSLNAQLGKYDHVCRTMSIADITTLAALLASHKHFQTLPKNVKKWFLNAPPNYLDIIKKLCVNQSWFS